MNKRRLWILAGLTSGVITGCAKPPAAEAPPQAASDKGLVSFEREIKPLLSNKCTICHNKEVLPKRPNFETREGALSSGMIVPGKPAQSRILTVVREEDVDRQAMPPVGHRVSDAERTLLIRWIAEGASWPAGEAGRIKPAFIPKE